MFNKIVNLKTLELNQVDRSEKVSNLIKGWGTPSKAPSTPKQENLPAKIKQTRLSGRL